MKLIEYFNQLLRNTVNLNTTRLNDLDSRVGSISDALKSSDELDGHVLDVVPQGSWAHATIIRPAEGLEFDADFLLELREDEDWVRPNDYAVAVWDALKDHSTYRAMTTRKNRCVRVTYANDCHVDIVPYVIGADGAGWIINRTTNQFEQTNPTGFTEWIQKQDDLTNRNLRKVIRLLKYLRDHRGSFKIKSVLLTTLVGNVVDEWRSYDPDYYKDVPTTLVHLVEDLDQWLQLRPTKPHLSDPSCPTSFDHRWTDSEYTAFRKRIHDLAPKIRTAYDELDKSASIEAWRDVFGPQFPTAVATTVAAFASAPVAKSSRVPGEQFIDEMYPVQLSHTVAISAELSDGRNRAERRLLRSRAGRVPKQRSVRFFVVATTVEAPFTLLWKVRNFGDEARTKGQLRGEITRDQGRMERTETTRYFGNHFVECYVVKDGVCVAITRESVAIR